MAGAHCLGESIIVVMRAPAIAVALAAIIGLGTVAKIGGYRLTAGSEQSIETDEISEADLEGLDMDASEAEPLAEEQPAVPQTPARAVDPDVVAPPSVTSDELVREEPRAPLSDIGLAQPPKPVVKQDWDGMTLFRPVAAAGGVLQSAGFTVSLDGIEPLGADETCTSNAEEWKCGALARTAMRNLLRGRAVVCAIDEGTQPRAITAKCRLGTQDIGLWLAGNGWARAVAGGPYEDAEKKARERRKGMFGSAPDTSLPPAPVVIEPMSSTGLPALSE